MSELLCLKWNNHSPAFLKKLSWLREKSQYCDATIVCKNKYFSVHKLVLSTCSEYFEEIFEKTQCKHPFVIVRDIQPTELEALLNYMYKGEINVLRELLPGLLKAAEFLQIKGLTDLDENVQSDEYSDGPISSENKSYSVSSVLGKRIKNLNNDFQKKCTSLKNISINQNDESSKKNYELHMQDFENLNDNINCSKIISESSQMKDEPRKVLEKVKKVPIFPTEEISVVLNEEKFSAVDNSTQEKEANDPKEKTQENHSQICGGSLSTICEMNMFETNEDISSIISDIPRSGGAEQEKDKGALKKSGIKCPLCSHIATKPCKLKLHMFKHSGEKPFSCPHCAYTARTRYHVTVHLRKHTGEKPFECCYCSYKASNKANISRHMRIHSNEKPYQCPQCPYAATQASHLQDHKRQHYD